MQRYLSFAVVLAVALGIAGCGGTKKLHTKGRLVKDGQPVTAGEGESFRVLLVPILPDGKPPGDYYVAQVDQAAGTFTVIGKDLTGMPAGKYRVAVEWMKKKQDQLAGAFDTENSPIVVDVDSSTAEIVVDLDKTKGA